MGPVGDSAESIALVVSEEFDYSAIISSDCGPRLASRCRWSILQPTQLGSDDEGVVPVIDDRITESEAEYIASLAEKGVPMVVWLGDPQVPVENRHLLPRVISLPNVRYASAAHPYGVAVELLRTNGPRCYHQHPFPYETEREVELDSGARSRRLAIYGRTSQSLYPRRTTLAGLSRRRPWLKLCSDVLDHPGYPDVGERLQHGVLGSELIQWLAEHRFVFVDPSVYEVELQRYCEVAYAGSVPVGSAPRSFDEEMSALILPFDVEHPERSLLSINRLRERDRRALALRYRAQLSEKRDPQLLNQRFLRWWRNGESR